MCGCCSITFLPPALAGPGRVAGQREALSPPSTEALAVRRSVAALQVMPDTAGELAVPASRDGAKGLMHRIPSEHKARLIELGYIEEVHGGIRLTAAGRMRIAEG